MRSINKTLMAGCAAVMIAGCIVREERPRRRVIVEDVPPPVPVEVIPVAPGPEFIYEPGVYVRVGGGWGWHHGYWHRR